MNDEQVRQQLHLIKIEDLTPAQIESSSGGVFLSRNEYATQQDIIQIVETFRSVKLPTYGCSIPNTTKIVSKAGDSGLIPLFVPDPNKTYQLIAADVSNVGASSLTIRLGLSDGLNFIAVNQVTAVAGSTGGSFNLRNVFTFDSSVFPAVLITAGTASDALIQLAYSELVQ